MKKYMIYNRKFFISFLIVIVLFFATLGCDNFESSYSEIEQNTSTPLLETTPTSMPTVIPSPTITSIPTPVEKAIKIRFGGDVTMSEFFGDALNDYGVDYMWEDVAELINEADFSFFNLETSVSNRGQSTKREGFGFRSNPLHLEGFVNAGVDMVKLSNNHVLDYGMDAFLDTLTHLDEWGIEYVGAGKNFKEASSVKYIEVEGITLAFFAATSILPSQSWIATENSGGVMPFQEAYYEEILDIISKANKKADYVFVLLHWGNEYVTSPTNSQKLLAREMIDSGADFIIGDHPHVLQEIEYYNGGMIYYSIGNFVFYKNTYESGLTGLFEIKLNKEKIISANIYPIFIDNLKANLLKESNTMYSQIMDIVQ